MSSDLTSPAAATGSSWQDAAKTAGQRVLALIRKYPVKFVMVAAVSIFAAAFLLHAAKGSATLKVQMQHSFRSGQVSVWVDGDLACTEQITGEQRRRFGLLPAGIAGNFSRILPVSAGPHMIRVRVTSDQGYDNSGSLSGDFPEGSQVQLQVRPRRSGDLGMSWQGMSTMAVESGPAWYTKYASSILMTAIGSLVSAVMAYVIKQAPNLLRGTSAPKA